MAQNEEWLLVDQITVPPKGSKIVIIEQKGVDLSLRIEARENVIIMQEGPDRAYGHEVAVLHNETQDARVFEVTIAPVHSGPEPRYGLSTIDSPSERELNLASAISQASRAWLENSTADDSETILMSAVPWSVDSQLQQIGIRTYLDILARSGKTITIPDLVDAFLQQIDFTAVDRTYLNWLTVEALLNEQKPFEAFLHMEVLTKEYMQENWLPSVSPATRWWLRTNIQATRGQVNIFAALAKTPRDETLLARAGEVLRRALHEAEKSKDFSTHGRLLSYLAGYYDTMEGRVNEVKDELFKESAHLLEKAGDNQSLISVRNNQANSELGRGNFRNALRLYAEALELLKHSKNIQGEAHVIARLAYAYYLLGDFDDADARFRESLALYEETKSGRAPIHTKLQYAELLREIGKVEEAHDQLDSVRRNLDAQSRFQDRLRLPYQLAQLHLDSGEIQEANKEMGQVDKLMDELSGGVGDKELSMFGDAQLKYALEGVILQTQIQLEEGNLDLALGGINRALAQLSSQLQEPIQQLALRNLKMEIENLTGDIDAMVATSQSALSIVNGIANEIDYENFGPQWASRTSNTLSFLSVSLLDHYLKTGNTMYLDQTIELIQSSRARGLRQMRHSFSDQQQVDGLERLENLKLQVIQQTMRAWLNGQPTEDYERQLARIKEQLLRLEKSRADLIDTYIFRTARDIQDSLDANDVLRTFILDEEKSYALILTNSDVQISELPPKHELLKLVDDAISEIAIQGQMLDDSKALADLLLPAVDRNGKQNNLLELDGFLSRVPFSILNFLTTSNENYFTYIPSMSEYMDQEDNFEGQELFDRTDVAVFANPEFSLIEPIDMDSSYKIWRNSLGNLPSAENEALRIVETFGDENTLAYIKESASIANLLSEPVRTSRILHIASHGFASDENAELIGLALANDKSTGSSGLLTRHQISAHSFKNELVVISSCESGAGMALEGEGIMSISRAFLASGAKATLSSLWQVADTATEQLMGNFYYAMKTLNYNPATALVFAQKRLQESSVYKSPFYWGAFVLHVANENYQPIN